MFSLLSSYLKVILLISLEERSICYRRQIIEHSSCRAANRCERRMWTRPNGNTSLHQFHGDSETFRTANTEWCLLTSSPVPMMKLGLPLLTRFLSPSCNYSRVKADHVPSTQPLLALHTLVGYLLPEYWVFAAK